MTIKVPDPIANTTTEAYLAYKAGFLEESELKPKLYEPYLPFDGWLAYWCGLTEDYPTDKNGDPEMLTDEEALVAYLAGVTDTYPEEIKDPYDVRIVGYLKHLASKRWLEPDYPVNNEEFYLSTMEPTHTSNPVPSSDIELDTAEGKIISVEAYGDTFQQMYSGTNLFDYSDINSVSTGVTVGDDGWVTMIYDNSGGASTKYLNYYTNILPLSTNTNYNVIIEIKNFTGDFSLYPVSTATNSQFSNQWYIGSSGMSEGGIYSRVIKTNPDFDGDIISLRTTSAFSPGKSGSVTFRLSLLADTSVTPETFVYQPYTGGIPAPNPDYPETINVVTGVQTVEVKGKNLLAGNYSSQTAQGIGKSWDNVYVTLSGTTSNTYSNITQNLGIPLPPGTYTFSTDKPASQFTKIARIRYGNANHDQSIAKNATSVTFTIPDGTNDALLVLLYIGNMAVNTQISETFGVMLEKSATPTTFQPYTSQTYTIDLGATELCKLSSVSEAPSILRYQDYIYKSGNDWYIHKEIGKAVYDGSVDEEWGLHNTYNSIPSFRWLGSGVGHSNSAILSDKLLPIYITTYNSNSRTYGKIATLESSTTSVNDTVFITAPNSSVTTLAQFTSWISNNNVTVYYAMPTPTDTKITDATLISELEALAGADTYNEKTFIKVTANDPNLPALLKVEAYKY